jgi:hypothetical protein
MCSRLSGIAIGIVALMAVGCSDRNQPLPPTSSMQAAAPIGGITCDFKSLNQLATHYFSAQEAKAVRGLISAMQTAGAFTATAQDRGFDVMTHVAANVNAGNNDVADASGLTNGLLACMFATAAELPATFPEDFSVAVDPSQHGGYDVRGGATDPATAPVFNRPLTAPFSGIKPTGTSTWADVLAGNPAPHRILVYGRPGALSQTYDWKVAPANASFAPPVMVGVCIDPFTATTSLLREEHTGLLPFADFAELVPGVCSPVAARATSLPAQLAARVRDFFLPSPLGANPGGLAGTTGGIHSVFGPQVVDTVTLTFTTQPSDVNAGQIIAPPVQVLATANSSGDAVPSVSVTLGSINNNGTPAFLSGTLTQVTDGSGIATFGDLSQSKTGGYAFVATGTVNGRGAIVVAPATSVRFNVRP